MIRPARLLPTPSRLLRIVLMTGVWSLLFFAPVVAQEDRGPILPSGWFRLDFGPGFAFADSRFGERSEGGTLVEEEEPLGFDFSAAVDENIFPGLLTLEEALRAASPGSAVELNLGASDVFMTQDAVVFPIGLDIGVTNWLSVGARVPFSRRRSEVLVSYDAESANAGVSPTISDPTAVSDFLGQLGFAISSLTGMVDQACQADPAGTQCLEMSGLLDEAGGFQGAMGTAYLNRLGFPLDGTELGSDLTARAGDLAGRFSAAGIGAFPTAVPLATERYDAEGFRSLITGEDFGIEGEPLANWRSRWEMGDVEVHAHVRLLGASMLAPYSEGSGLRYELGIGGLMRIGTGTPDSEDNFVDLGSGDGTTDFEGRVFANIRTGFHLGLWASARYGRQGSIELVRRVTPTSQPLAPTISKRLVEWTPGDYLQIELVPRVELTEQLLLVGIVRHTANRTDSYRLIETVAPEVVDAGWLELETEASLTELGLGVVYTGVSSPGGRPMDVRFQLSSAIAGSGGQATKWFRVGFGMRFYGRFWGRPLRP